MGGCPTLLVLSIFLIPRIHLANSNLYHPSYILFYIIRVIIFATGWVSLDGRLSYLVVPHSNNLVSLKQIFTIVYSL